MQKNLPMVPRNISRLSFRQTLHTFFQISAYHVIITSIYKYIILCLDNCPKPNCADVNEQLKLQSEGQLSTVEEENDLFEKPEDDSVTTSTSVYVAQPGSPESGENYFLIFAPKKLRLHW